jgi:hypothetical protein
MDKSPTTGDAPADESRADKVRRQALEKQTRLAEALRVNLHRRKAQSRARAETPERPADRAGPDKPGR